MVRLRFALFAVFGTMLAASAVAAQHDAPAGRAGTSLRNAQNQMVGTATAARQDGIVRVRIDVRGFAPGTYGVHLHQTGRCEAPDFASAGPHWNPAARQHGRHNPQGPHLGDLPNLEVRANGTGRVEFDVAVPAGTAAGANPLLDVDGTAVVVHAAADDERTDPSGNSGARIACGVFAAR
ncbi:MAG TPA: superoxide dismutase family protein [Allosphingosinicella sp.]|nr:superoxide dismutase family protein [Allosphingosinicella sp.]